MVIMHRVLLFRGMIFFLLINFIGFCFFLVGCIDKFKPKKEIKTDCPQGIEPVYKVLFIGWDGVRSDALQAASTPNLDSLLTQSIYSYHVDRGPYTVSTPGWSTILHGVWPNKHGLTENSFRKNNYDKYPDIFCIMRKTKPNLGLATLSNWDAFLQITSSETYAQRFDSDPKMTIDALNKIDQCTPDAMLLHFDFPDDTGHDFGFSPNSLEYLSSISTTDNYLGLIMNQIKQREIQKNEKWMVVLTTDHGGEGTGHGGQDQLDQTRYVWYVVRTPDFTSNQVPEGKTVDLLPTILKWMACSSSTSGLDGTALY